MRRAVRAGGRGSSRFLVVRQDNRLGNLLLLTPFLRRLREAEPTARIALLAGEAYGPLVRQWPWVDEWIIQEKRRHARAPWLFLPWIAQVRRRGWDLAFEASNHDTHSYYNCLLALASGASERVGFDHPRSRPALTCAVPRPPDTLHFSLAPLALLRSLGMSAEAAPIACPLSLPESATLSAWRRREGVEHGYLVVHLGGRDAKSWPLEGWSALLPRLAAMQPGPIVVVAGPAEEKRLAELAASPRWIRAPRLGVTDLAHLVERARAFVGCDSGVMHLAAALATPTIALFFRSNPYHYGPLGGAHRTVLLADRYSVDDAEWARGAEGLARSPLLRCHPAGDLERDGRPEIGPAAVETILRAVTEALVGEGARLSPERAMRSGSV